MAPACEVFRVQCHVFRVHCPVLNALFQKQYMRQQQTLPGETTEVVKSFPTIATLLPFVRMDDWLLSFWHKQMIFHSISTTPASIQGPQ